MWNPFKAIGNLFAGVHFEWKEDQNHEWVGKPYLIWAIVIITGFVSVYIWLSGVDTQQKANNAPTFAMDTQTEMCSTFGGNADQLVQDEWQKFAQDAGAPILPMPALNFVDAHNYYMTQCPAAQSYVASVSQATTEEHKAQLFRDIRAFREAVANHTSMLREQQFVSAQGCLNSYLAAAKMQTTLGQTQANVSQAFTFMQMGDWQFCSFYAQQGMEDLKVFIPTNTPTPWPTATNLPGTPEEPFWSGWSDPEPTRTPIVLFATPGPTQGP